MEGCGVLVHLIHISHTIKYSRRWDGSEHSSHKHTKREQLINNWLNCPNWPIFITSCVSYILPSTSQGGSQNIYENAKKPIKKAQTNTTPQKTIPRRRPSKKITERKREKGLNDQANPKALWNKKILTDGPILWSASAVGSPGSCCIQHCNWAGKSPLGKGTFVFL